MAAVFVSAPCLGLRFGSVSGCSVAGELVERFTRDTTEFYVVCNGRIVDSDEQLENGSVYHLDPRLTGGKGGFGSMLRALGAQIEKTTNREACRDLSGRRLRDVNHEKEMAEWLKKQSEREAEKEQRRLERIQKKLAEPKHQFTDSGFTQICHELSERLEDSVLKGLQVDKPVSKRPLAETSGGPEVKKVRAGCSWTGLDELLSSDEDLEEEEEARPSSSSSSSSASPGPSQAYSQATSSPASEEEPRGPEEDQRGAEECQKDPEKDQRGPEDDQRGPEDDQRGPEDDQRGPEEDQRGPEKDQRGPEDDQRGPEKDQRGPEEDQRGPKKDQRRSEEIQRGPEKDQRGPEKELGGGEVEQREPDSTSDQSEAKPVESSSRPDPAQEQRPLDLDSVSRPEDLEVLGLNTLKEELMRRGLKCGGTLSERAARLFSIKGKRPEQIDPSLLAKTSKKQK